MITDVINNYTCYIDHQKVPKEICFLNRDQVDNFVTEVLLNKERALPVIMISTDMWSDKPVVNYRNVHKSVFGLAQVVVLSDKWAAFKLTDVLGKNLSCFNGAIRIYWPGFNRNANQSNHPLYLPELGRNKNYQKKQIERKIIRQILNINTYRFAEGSITKAIRTHFEQESKKNTEISRARLKEISSDNDELQKMVEDSWDENDELKKQLENKEKTIEDLQFQLIELDEENNTLKENLKEVYKYENTKDDNGIIEQPDIQDEPLESVMDSIIVAEKRFENILVIYDTAKQSAEKSSFSRPDDVFKSLMAIAEVGREHFKAKKSGDSIGRWEDAFKQKGVTKFSPTDSNMTMNKYGNDRNFTHNGKTVEMKKHITLGGGSGTNCIQIYFEPNEETGKIEIGYCGKHLPFYRQRT